MARTGLVISGGGSKGAFAVGVVEVLREYGYSFDMIAGTSTGALIAPLVAIDDIDTLVKLYTNVSNKDIIRLNWRKLFINSLILKRGEVIFLRILSQNLDMFNSTVKANPVQRNFE